MPELLRSPFRGAQQGFLRQVPARMDFGPAGSGRISPQHMCRLEFPHAVLPKGR